MFNNSMTNWDKIKIKNLIDYKTKEVDNLPDGVSISTMCCSAKLGTIIDINNIQEYLQLNENDILTVKLNERTHDLIIKHSMSE